MKHLYTPDKERWVNRETLKLDIGEWVCVVGWLEDTRMSRKVSVSI
jgi:hypothetical protein